MKITYTVVEPSTKQDPFFLQNLRHSLAPMYDRPFEPTENTDLTIRITIPENLSVFIIDDLHFINTASNTIEFTLGAGSQLIYQLFVANHELCDQCESKELYDCQKLPTIFEKTVNVTLAQPNAQAYLKCHYFHDFPRPRRCYTII